MAYVCAGDPTLDATIDVVLALERAGVDIVELGVPFSDPLADGVVNQMAADRALKAGASMPKVLEMIRQLRTKSQIPLVLFTYLNPRWMAFWISRVLSMSRQTSSVWKGLPVAAKRLSTICSACKRRGAGLV